jgi:DNA polymerase elongation subunit (family B)
MEHILKLLEKNKITREKALGYVRALYSRSKYCYSSEEEKGKTKKRLVSGEPIKVQAIDWFNRNEKITVEYVDEDGSGSTETKQETQYVIYLYGITEFGETITARFTDYTPYFYVKVPEKMSESTFQRILDESIESNFNSGKMGGNLFERYKSDMIECSFCSKIDFWGFQNKQTSKFARIIFRNTYALKAYEKAFQKPVKIHPNVYHINKIKFDIYESNIDSMLRFFHWRNIEPCGWLEIKDYTHNSPNEFSNTAFEIEANWKDVSSKAEDSIARIFEASFDIECDSSDGSFPLAKKDWTKIINPLLDDFIYHDGEVTINGVRDFIIDKVSQKHLVPKRIIPDPVGYFGAKFNPVETEVINQYFKKLVDITLERRNGADSKEKKVIDEKIDKLREELKERLNKLLPELEGDKCIQIGTTVKIYGMDTTIDFIFTLKSAVIPEKPSTIIWYFDTEQEVLLEFTKLLQALDPDLLTGYNIFGFDMKFLYHRAQELQITAEFLKMSRMVEFECPFKTQDLSSSAMGTNILEYIDIPGRVVFDLMKYMRRNHQLDSYKLDAVVNNFMRGEVKKTEADERGTWLYSELSEGIKKGNYVTLQKNNYVYEDKYKGGEKIEILEVDPSNGRFLINDKLVVEQGWKYSWSEGKDDIDPQQIFGYQKKDEIHRGIIAKYCLQDCRLCNRLLNKLDVIVNSVAMANVNSVPLSFIFNRGQGVKLFSFVSKRAKERNYCIPVIRYIEKADGEDDSYEGAFVLDPKVGIYFEKEPIAVADFNSLYPSCMISENLCHSTICLDPKYQGVKGAKLLAELGHTYEDISWDLYDEKDVAIDKKVVRYVQPKDGERGVLPEILEVLLKCRKDVRKKQKEIKDPQKWKVLEGQQLAYKVTANSLYGVTGASTSPLCLKDIAAATTATGRKNIIFAKDFVEREYPGTDVVYGDTDSIFIKFPVSHLNGLDAIYKAIDMCEEASGRISALLKQPHNLEFEKVICPMILCAKKKYVGFYYSGKSPKYTIKYMGIVLKRRDNAPIVKHVFGEAIEILLKENNVPKAISFIQNACKKIIRGEYGMDKFVMSKTLRDGYKNPEGIAHKVLADRMGERDPGNKPMINDRIPFVYVEQDAHIKGTKKKNILQGDKIEHQDYVIKHNLPIDYLHYITNQIMNPVCQVFDLVMKKSEEVIFSEIVKEEEARRLKKAMKKSGYQEITSFFKKSVTKSTKII